MGGSGGGGGGSKPSAVKSVSCNELKFSTNLVSPNEAVLSLLSIGMELDMVLAPSKNACVVIFENKVAGSIVSHLVQLINCINAGHRFLARIRSIDGSKCVVMVLHESLI